MESLGCFLEAVQQGQNFIQRRLCCRAAEGLLSGQTLLFVSPRALRVSAEGTHYK